MTLDDQKQQFSFAYVRAVGAAARVVVSEPSVDDDSVDLAFQQRTAGGPGRVRSPRLDVQVKCTESASVHPGHVAYPLKLKNYDDLRSDDLLVPRILIVVLVPVVPDPDDLTNWLAHSEQELALRRCGYWVSLRGQAATANTTNVTVHLPRANLFDVAQLQAMMERIGNRQLP